MRSDPCGPPYVTASELDFRSNRRTIRDVSLLYDSINRFKQKFSVKADFVYVYDFASLTYSLLSEYLGSAFKPNSENCRSNVRTLTPGRLAMSTTLRQSSSRNSSCSLDISYLGRPWSTRKILRTFENVAWRKAKYVYESNGTTKGRYIQPNIRCSK